MHNMIERFKHKINELKNHCNKLYKKNGKLKQIIDNSKPKYLISKKKRMHKTRKNKKYEKYFITQSKSTFIIHYNCLFHFFLDQIFRQCQRQRQHSGL